MSDGAIICIYHFFSHYFRFRFNIIDKNSLIFAANVITIVDCSLSVSLVNEDNCTSVAVILIKIHDFCHCRFSLSQNIKSSGRNNIVELNISMLWSKCKSHQTHYRSYRGRVCQSTEGRVQIRHLYSCYTQK